MKRCKHINICTDQHAAYIYEICMDCGAIRTNNNVRWRPYDTAAREKVIRVDDPRQGKMFG